MDEAFSVLSDAYGRVRAGGTPLNRAVGDLSSVVSSCVADPAGGGLKATCLSLSLVEKIATGLSKGSLSEEATAYFQELVAVLKERHALAERLLSVFGSQDRILSHLAAKCVSSLVTCDLQTSKKNDCCSIWEGVCHAASQQPYPCNGLDACLWSFTSVIKDVLKRNVEHRPEDFKKLLTILDPHLMGLHMKLLSEEDFCTADDWGTTLMMFMDLLEALTAARIRLKTCFPSQRLLFLQTPLLLKLLECNTDYFVQKKVVLLLKRSLLYKPGEDWQLGEGSPILQQDEWLGRDTWALAGSVLQIVNYGWLKRMFVNPRTSFFGGNFETCPDGRRSDHVMLRAISLVLLKSLEYGVQAVPSVGGSQTVDMLTFIHELLVFLGQQGIKLKHSCSWVSLVFSDQDDDMIEAAKALIVLYSHQSSLGFGTDATSCDLGLNPHCHFIFLLRSVVFDHSVLLDFLISSETCFLEYFVRYLKHLRDDWGGFCCACLHFDNSDSERQLKSRDTQIKTLIDPCNDISTLNESEGPNAAASQSDAACCLPTQPVAHLPPRLQLVDYGSSEDSGEEEMDACEGSCAVRRPETIAQECNVAYKQVFARGGGPLTAEACSMYEKIVSCLKELRKVLSRLQKRNLFPYNPASLLKLLALIEEKYIGLMPLTKFTPV
ncbi:protein Lines homolog 1 isoform X2 [Denticeps clupeoides]|uniref:Lines homolog 1 n=1 Tax=Denticeps clupeoides TaxID=299321 RepID=A0AAY4EBU3_9TELE|nr:protein Lines homolog 1 isoform X2 [Denticeps clupeoides]